MSSEIVQALWIGSRLGVMEQLSIRSYLCHGYQFHLYVYEDVEGIPAGTEVRSGEEILSTDEIFCIRKGFGKGNFATFSDVFRFKLLLERGGWWTDLDAVCLKPLDFPEDHVAGAMRLRGNRGTQIACGMLKAPAGSPIIEYCRNVCRQVGRDVRFWGQIGPMLLTEAVRNVKVPFRVLDPACFYPINYWHVWQMVLGREIPSESHAIHFWHSAWGVQRLDPDAVYDSDCIYEQLKRRYGVASPPGAPRGPSWRALGRYWLGKVGMSGLP